MDRAPRVCSARPRTLARTALATLVVALGLAVTAPAFAAPPTPQDKWEAVKLSREAELLVKQGKLAEAAQKLERADGLDPMPEYKVALAEVDMALGRLAAAKGLAIEVGAMKPATPAQKKAIDRAHELGYELEDRTPSLTVAVEGPSAERTRVLLDGAPFVAGQARAADPGHHELIVEAPGYARQTLTVDLKESDAKTLPVRLERVEGDATGGGDEVVATSSGGFDKLPAVLAWGVGGAWLLVAIGTGAQAMISTDEVNTTYGCDAISVCHPPLALRGAFEDDLAQARAFGNASTAGFVLAGVGAAAGAVLWVMSDQSQSGASDAASLPSVLPLVAPGFVGASGRF